MIKGIVSGYFNPLHRGHIEYIHESKIRCEHLIVIVNNDNQVKIKKSKQFMDESHRCFIINSLKDVNEVKLSIDKDNTICQTLISIVNKYPNDILYFFNSGDRSNMNNIETEELKICQKYKIKYVVIDMIKTYSSSTLLSLL